MTNRKKMKAKMRDYILFIPNLLRLLIRLLKDPRVSSADKAILAGTILYVISPIDVLPDFIPFIGLVDDSYLIGISVLRLLNRAERTVVLEHWHGVHDIKGLVSNIASVASYFLPERVRNVLQGRIETKGRFKAVSQPGAVKE